MNTPYVKIDKENPLLKGLKMELRIHEGRAAMHVSVIAASMTIRKKKGTNYKGRHL